MATIRVRPQGMGQRISRGAAWMSYAAALGCLIALAGTVGDLGGQHPVIASLAAAVVFFVGAGVVLHVMGLASLPSLRFGAEDQPPPGS